MTGRFTIPIAHFRPALPILLLLLMMGCVSKPTATVKPVFFPPPPDEPRVQFLTSFSTSADVAPQSRFSILVLGRQRPTPIYKPYGVATSPGRIYVCDSSCGVIDILDLAHKKMELFSPRYEGQLRVPINIAVDRDGTRYVADTGHGQVLIYSADGSFNGALGPRDTKPLGGHKLNPAGGFGDEEPLPASATAGAKTNAVESLPLADRPMKPTDVLIHKDRLYVADMAGQCVRVYDATTRALLFAIPGDGSDDKTRLFQPTNLAMSPDDKLYVSDTGGFRVQQYTADGTFVGTIGEYGLSPGRLALPKGIDVDREGRLYVVDAKSQVAQIFSPEGQLLMFFGEPNASEAPLDLPASVAIDYDNVGFFRHYAAPGFELEYLIIICNQYGNRKVSVYGFGHRG